MESLNIQRYQELHEIVTPLHHLDDALDMVAFLTSNEFVVEKLSMIHRKSLPDAKALAKRIVPHAALALEYARLSLNAAAEVAFLPSYYAVLNLAKVCCLAGSVSNEFDLHMSHHGITYSSRGKASQQLMTETVTMYPKGALTLFYKTLTGRVITTRRKIAVGEVYQFVPGVSAEVEMITNQKPDFCRMAFDGEIEGKNLTLKAQVTQNAGAFFTGNVRCIPPLTGFKKVPAEPGTFLRRVPVPSGASDLMGIARSVIRTEFLLPRFTSAVAYVQKAAFPMPEEFAAALAFFHMSSVCRYNPEFLERLRLSMAWPLLLALRRHSLFDFLIKTFSFFLQKNVRLHANEGASLIQLR